MTNTTVDAGSAPAPAAEERTRNRERAFVRTSALLFILSALVTVVWCGSMSGGMAMSGGWTMSMVWMQMPGQSALGAAAMFMGMWIVMMVAMMLPSLVPMLERYRRSIHGPAGIRLGSLTALAGMGYFLVWTLFGVAAYPIGVAFAAAEMRWTAVARQVPLAVGVVLLAAGAFQLTARKERQLGRCCDAPYGHSADPRSAWRHGLRLGAQCCACCFGFMAVLLVTGVMDLGAMAAVAAGITAERLSPRPGATARAAGLVLIVAGVFAIVRARGAV